MIKSNPPNSNKWQLPRYQKIIFKPKRTKYCLCIPVINEGDRIKLQLAKIKQFSPETDILILDGGSSDGSVNPSFLKQMGVRALLTKSDKGKLSAQLRMGYAFALEEGYKGIITMDGNGKDGVEAIPDFVSKLTDGFDYVQGSRFIKGGRGINTPFSRYLANRFFHAPLISWASNSVLTDTTNGFRAYSSNYLLNNRVQPFRDIFQRYELLAYLSVRANQLGFRVSEVPVVRRYPSGKIPTKINLLDLGDLLLTLLKAITNQYSPKK